jgi:hypothetical protein
VAGFSIWARVVPLRPIAPSYWWTGSVGYDRFVVTVAPLSHALHQIVCGQGQYVFKTSLKSSEVSIYMLMLIVCNVRRGVVINVMR